MLKRQNAKGFTLVEVLVVVVILAILAAIAVPIYLQYVASARAAEAQEAIAAIWSASKIYQAKFGRPPQSTNQLDPLLKLDPLVIQRWTFTMQSGNQQVQKITANSTGLMPGGAGRRVEFDAVTGKWRGYGTD